MASRQLNYKATPKNGTPYRVPIMVFYQTRVINTCANALWQPEKKTKSQTPDMLGIIHPRTTVTHVNSTTKSLYKQY